GARQQQAKVAETQRPIGVVEPRRAPLGGCGGSRGNHRLIVGVVRLVLCVRHGIPSTRSRAGGSRLSSLPPRDERQAGKPATTRKNVLLMRNRPDRRD